jgi:hypothetical protein
VVIDASSVALLILILTGVGVGWFVHLARRDQRRRPHGRRRSPLRLVKNAPSTGVRDVRLLRTDTERASTNPHPLDVASAAAWREPLRPCSGRAR